MWLWLAPFTLGPIGCATTPSSRALGWVPGAKRVTLRGSPTGRDLPMLQKLRDKTSGWIATAILGLLMIPFLFVIDNSYLGGIGANNGQGAGAAGLVEIGAVVVAGLFAVATP